MDTLEVFINDVNFFLDFTAQIFYLSLSLFIFRVMVPSVSDRLLLMLRLSFAV